MKRVVVAVGFLALVGCGQAPWEDSLRDLEGAEVRDPGHVVIWNNIDGHPNIARLCLEGVAFATTTRDTTSDDSVNRVPEWDDECVGVEDSVVIPEGTG